MVIECKDQCRHHLTAGVPRLSGDNYYCRTCAEYLPVTFLSEKQRCGCCNNLIRTKPRHQSMNHNKLAKKLGIEPQFINVVITPGMIDELVERRNIAKTGNLIMVVEVEGEVEAILPLDQNLDKHNLNTVVVNDQ